MVRRRLCNLLLRLVCLACLPLTSWAAVTPVHIAVLAFRPAEQVEAQWRPLAEALTATYPEYEFHLHSYNYPELNQAVARRSVDFVLTNPAHYVFLAQRFQLPDPLATLINLEGGQPVTQFGGVIVRLAERTDIQRLDQLEGLTIAAVSVESLGGYLTQAYELLKQGINPSHQVNTRATGMPHDRVIEALLAGEADVGFIRTGLIERMIAEGRLDAHALTLLNPQEPDRFPSRYSTALYPEWPITALAHVEGDIQRKVLRFLLATTENPELQAQIQFGGFDIAADYSAIYKLLRDLKFPPFDEVEPISLHQIWENYAQTLVIILGSTLLLFALLIVYLLGLTRRLRWEQRLVTEQSGVLKENADQLRLASQVFTHANEGIVIANPAGELVEVNQAFCQLTGYPEAEWLDKPPEPHSFAPAQVEFIQPIWEHFGQRGHWQGEVSGQCKDGARRCFRLSINGVENPDKDQRHVIAIFSDITAQKHYQQQLEQMAHFDALTLLPNRVLLADRLNQAMVFCQRHQRVLAVIYIDLDGFKEVNDTYGHSLGDQLLQALATRMKQTLRREDTLSRIGGDEFVAVLTEFSNVHECTQILNRLLEICSSPIMCEHHRMQVSASLGVTFYPQDEEVEADQLLRQADQAMYNAKLNGKNRYHIYDAEHDRNVRGYHQSLVEISQALEDGQFVLYYQPKVNLRSGELLGVEALIRWQHPERGLLSPFHFLPVIENHALSIEVGEWVLREAMQQYGDWLQQGQDIAISVNISAYQLQQYNFTERLFSIFNEFPQVPRSRIEIEILETSAFHDLQKTSEIIRHCNSKGVEFALDDFGTGYSSLAYLRHLPVKTLKIDQTFVMDMLDDPEDFAIMEGIYGLGIAFQREILAEGVETEAHGKMLLQLGCEMAQGYAIARPMPAKGLLPWFAQWQPFASWQNTPTLERDDLSLLYAGVEHRHWIKQLEAYLAGHHQHPPEMHAGACRFGHWLKQKLKQAPAVAIYTRLQQHHLRLHESAQKLCQLASTQAPELGPWQETFNQEARALTDLLEQLLAETDPRV
ncbi:EAL domain-containing protein [Nitrincola tapanii]|uniref:EAL domain-containing protein n=1 Tax=Nitrincola tapanii TaxID=1708751 RepID=A0A5A9W3N2_9GAMM|nr:EAL domain-containing protein [Nitrincola tapanii]KAA0874161.1 EAL domain-containing protein [Nitrincola tapanii]